MSFTPQDDKDRIEIRQIPCLFGVPIILPGCDYLVRTEKVGIQPKYFEYYEAWEWGYDKKDEFYLAATVENSRAKTPDQFSIPGFGPNTSGWSKEEGTVVFIEGEQLYQRKDGEPIGKDGKPVGPSERPALIDGWVRQKVQAARGVPTWDKDGRPPLFPAGAIPPNHVMKVRWNDRVIPKEPATIVKEIPKP